MKSISLDKIITEVQLNIVHGTIEAASKLEIKNRGVNKGGLELIGQFYEKDKGKMIVFGSKETTFIKTLKEEEVKKSLLRIFKEHISTIVFAGNTEIPQIAIDAAKESNGIILQSNFGYTDTAFQIAEFLALKLSTTSNIHGTMLRMNGKGVVITGESGIGKSETTLELIRKGHSFIVDDGLVVRRVGKNIFGEAPETIKNLIEVRGIGIIDITKMFGESVTLDSAKVDYIFNLKKFDKNTDFDRLGEKLCYKEILGIKVPVINIPVSAARNTSTLIEIALSNQVIKEKGYNALDLYRERINQNVK